jgi:hypothetical protein
MVEYFWGRVFEGIWESIGWTPNPRISTRLSGVNCPGNYSSNSFTCMSSQPNRNHRIHILNSSVLLRWFALQPCIGSAGRSAYVVMVSRTNLTRATASTTPSSSCSVVIPMRPCVHGSSAFMTLLPIRRETSGGCHHAMASCASLSSWQRRHPHETVRPWFLVVYRCCCCCVDIRIMEASHPTPLIAATLLLVVVDWAPAFLLKLPFNFSQTQDCGYHSRSMLASMWTFKYFVLECA